MTMNDTQTIHDIIEDHALERVPAGERHGWLTMSWNTVGIVNHRIHVGAMSTFIVGQLLSQLLRQDKLA